MLISKLTQLLTRLALGKEAAMALTLLQLISEALQSHQVNNVARFVFAKLPANWKTPTGPATENEFVAMIQAGELFLAKVRDVLKS